MPRRARRNTCQTYRWMQQHGVNTLGMRLSLPEIEPVPFFLYKAMWTHGQGRQPPAGNCPRLHGPWCRKREKQSWILFFFARDTLSAFWRRAVVGKHRGLFVLLSARQSHRTTLRNTRYDGTLNLAYCPPTKKQLEDNGKMNSPTEACSYYNCIRETQPAPLGFRARNRLGIAH